MQLTQKQESLISQHLRDVARRLDAGLSDQARERSLRQVQSRIYGELEALRNPAISDSDVLAALQRNGAREAQPAAPAPRQADRAGTARATAKPDPHESASRPVWLGVCAYNAERFGLEPWMPRLGAVLLGLVTGPLALLCYVGAFAEYYLSLDEADRPPIAPGPLALRALAPLAVLVALRWGAGKVEALIAYGHEQLVKAPLPAAGDWAWLEYYGPTYFYLAVLSVVPLGILSGLPMANAWGHSLKRLAQAIVALYGVMLCFGLASVIVGVIIDRVEVYLQ